MLPAYLEVAKLSGTVKMHTILFIRAFGNNILISFVFLAIIILVVQLMKVAIKLLYCKVKYRRRILLTQIHHWINKV